MKSLAPTHNLTLTRTTSEMHILHTKLRDSHPSVSLPPFPLEASDVGTGPPGKRRSSFLHTLSRLASPSPKQRSPAIPVSKDADDDPFVASHPTVTTGLAAYLTALSNDQIIRVSKHWRRFVRVRTDDLQSVRVERAIKRVRSDLAMHPAIGGGLIGSANPSTSALVEETSAGILKEDTDSFRTTTAVPSEVPQATLPRTSVEPSPLSPDRSLLDDENTAVAAAMATATPQLTPSPSPIIPNNSSMAESLGQIRPSLEQPIGHLDPSGSGEQVASDQDQSTPASPTLPPKQHYRIPRSASADPDRSGRLSRAFKSSATVGTDTEDEATVPKPRKKRSGDEQPRKSTRKVTIDDFEMMRVLGKGCAGKVLLVKHKATADMYALKAITKRHVLAHQELLHTLTEQAVLKRMAREGADPFVVKLWWSFHDKENLFLVMDFHPGGDLATQLARWGRLGRDRARFYAAEIVEGVEGLHAAGVIYRDLKPENILIGVDGHIVLTDFGLSKEFPRTSTSIPPLPTAPTTPSGSRDEYYSSSDSAPISVAPYWMKGDGSGSWHSSSSHDSTSTFCGTAEYLAPEVIQGLPYSYEVDWWSFGTMLFEMLTGIVSKQLVKGNLPNSAFRHHFGRTIIRTCMCEYCRMNCNFQKINQWSTLR